MDKYRIGIDVGTTCMKTSVQSDGVSVPVVWELTSSFLPTQDELFSQYGLEQPRSCMGIVGEDVGRYDPYNVTRAEDLYGNKKHKLAIFYAIAASLDHINAPEKVTVWLGLAIPSGHMGMSEALIEMLGGKKINCVKTLKGKPRQVIIERVLCVPQGQCVVIDQVFQWKKQGLVGDRGRDLLKNGSISAAVLGSNTVELALFKGNFKTIKTESVFRGVLEVTTELAPLVHKRCGFFPKQAQLINDVLCKKSLAGQDFEHINRKLIHAFMRQYEVKSGIDFFFKNAGKEPGKQGTLILAGGPCLYGIEPIEKQFADDFVKIGVAKDERNKEEPRLAVIRGLAKTLTIKQQGE